MNHYQLEFYLPIFFFITMTSCQSCISTSAEISDDIISRETSLNASTNHNDFCNYFYSKDTLNDTLYFKFEDMEDYGPVYLSDDELKQIYCEIKRGNTNAYKILCDYYFCTYSLGIPKSEIDKMICITDYLVQKYSYYRAYLVCGNIIYDYINLETDEYYASKMIVYYEKYFEFSRSKAIAKKLFEIYCGNYSFQDKDSIKANYYREVIFNN